jgi:hypothetical protein
MRSAAATDGPVFRARLDRVLLPEPRRVEPAAVPVADGLAAPGGPCARLDGAGVTHRHLPRCSPDPSPIEPVRAELEGLLRKAAARAVDGLHAALGPASAAIIPPDARGFFRPAGHARPN